ncbi:tripartite tricarboxylate transporter substrate-binding protein [Jiangella ureilytica]|nr:tripartite tricarboxylate transporter substrate-binding protein [Jiangella ureilytica]
MLSGLAAGTMGVTLGACGQTGGEGTDSAEDPAAFFDGETITMVVPYNPGGGFDTFVRLLETHLEDEIEGVQVNVKNSPGGGSLIGTNEIYQAEPDGLTIGLINYPGSMFAEATGTDGVSFDNSKWTFLARLGAINPIVFTGEDSGYESFQQMIDSDEPITFGIGGRGSDAYYATVIMAEVLGFDAEIIAGYGGGEEADAALLVGEVDASINSADAALTRIEGTGAHINALISTQPNEQLPDVPLITEFGDAEQQEVLSALASIYDLERLLVAPPGMDEERAQVLADAVFAAASSDGYVQEMEAAGLTPSPMERAEVLSLVEDVNASIDLLKPIIEE